MKKTFLLMLALLCSAVQGWADKVTDLSQLDNDKVYTIRSERAFLLFSDKMPGELCSSTGKSVGSVTYSLTDPNLQFSIQKDGSSYHLFSVGAQKYVGQNGKFTDAANAVLTIEKVDNASYPWKMCVAGQGLNTQIAGQANSGIAVNSWTTTDAGNCFFIEEAVPEDKVYNVIVLGTDNAEAGFSYGENTYKNGATIETKDVIKASDVTAVAVEGMFALVTVEGMNIYVSYLEEGTKFYTLQGGHGGYVSMNSDYQSGGNLLLNNANKVIRLEKIGVGGMTGTTADPKKIFKCALENNATSVMLCHNHPSGNTTPSNADKQITNNLIKAGQFLEIKILDHIIIGNDNYFSFADEGLL